MINYHCDICGLPAHFLQKDRVEHQQVEIEMTGPFSSLGQVLAAQMAALQKQAVKNSEPKVQLSTADIIMEIILSSSDLCKTCEDALRSTIKCCVDKRINDVIKIKI